MVRSDRQRPEKNPDLPLPHGRGSVSNGAFKAKLRRTEETPWNEVKKVKDELGSSNLEPRT